MPPRVVQLLLCLTLVLPSAAAGAEPDLSGTYLLAQRATSVAEVPVLADITAETRSVALLELTQRGSRLVGSGALCHIEIVSSASLVHTELPPALKKIISDVVLDARLTPTRHGYQLRQPARVSVLGARLKEAAREPLPRSADDARVFDHDRDGHPGVTIRVHGIVRGELYVVQRAISWLDGHGRAGRFAGQLRVQTEDVVLDATRWMLKRRAHTRPDHARSQFWLQRLPPGSTCRDALKRAGGLW